MAFCQSAQMLAQPALIQSPAYLVANQPAALIELAAQPQQQQQLLLLQPANAALMAQQQPAYIQSSARILL